jgi:tetratricopeptide (TPR) repeat protein
MSQRAFISYSWINTDIADQLDKAFKDTGVIIQRDIREISYKDSIRDYMRQVRSADFALLIISDAFLKSPNCMNEVLELFKDENFKNKILPIIVDGTEIFAPNNQLDYIKYWHEKHSKLELDLKQVIPTDAIELYRTLKHYENIKTSIGDFLNILSEGNHPSFSKLAKRNFQEIFDYIGVASNVLIKEILALGEFKTDEERDIQIDILEAKYPENAKINTLKGAYSFEKGEIFKSIHFYRKAIEIDPTFGKAYYNLGYIMQFHTEDFPESKTLYEKSIELDPNNTRAYINLAILYLRVELHDNKDKARELLKEALSINPYDAEAKYNYGTLLWKEYSLCYDAKEQFMEILKLKPYDKKTLNQLAELLITEYKHFPTAKIYYDRFIMIEPNQAIDHYLYASFLMLHFFSSNESLVKKHYDLACSLDDSFKSMELGQSL